ncbi:Short-chain dehydrogenase/reductase SDR [Penicillium sp. DV-2018c]|nr:Short-chain dehydrogenase/reductase SDR [Penicillium sp. DV-2018c]KAJ5576711.1 Short-chain dehydrogenase/reductase SDR [Penicillium sp. DV-2018c]
MTTTQQILRSEVIMEKYGKKLAGKTILITGVSDESIAGELALQVSTANPKLLILTARAESKVAGIRARIHASAPEVQVRFLKMDLSDFADVRKAAGDLADVSHIDHLVCVAGVMMSPYSKTKDGMESQLAVNYLANFLLVKLLLPKVRAAGPESSVIIVASSAVRLGKMNFEDYNFSNGESYDPLAAYGQSNVARVMFVKRLGEKLKSEKIRVFSIDPGAVKTGLQRHCSPDYIQMIIELSKSGQPMKDVDGNDIPYSPWTGTSEAAATIITGMLDPTIAGQLISSH